MRTPLIEASRLRTTRTRLLAAAAALSRMAVVASAIAASVFGPAWTEPHAVTSAPDEPPGSGIIERTDVTAVWVPQALFDLARHGTEALVIRSPGDLGDYVERHRLSAAWYAVTYRGRQVDGDSAEITQIRRLSEAPAHPGEFLDVMASLAGNPPRSERWDFSGAAVRVIPERLLTVAPLEAITELIGRPGRKPGA